MADQIGLYYGHALFKEKHIIYVDQVQMEINCLNALINIIFHEKKALKTNIKLFTVWVNSFSNQF